VKLLDFAYTRVTFLAKLTPRFGKTKFCLAENFFRQASSAGQVVAKIFKCPGEGPTSIELAYFFEINIFTNKMIPPTVMAESATLKTGQTRKSRKSIT